MFNEQTQSNVCICDNTTLLSFVMTDGYQLALKSPDEKIINFIFQAKVLEEALDYTLYKNSQGCKTDLFQRLILLIFTNSSNYILDRLSKDHTVISCINHLLINKIKMDMKNCGYFGQIIESLCAISQGQILNDFEGLSDYLIDNLNCLALKDLLLALAHDYTKYFQIDQKMLELLIATSVTNSKTYFSISFTQKLFTFSNDYKELISSPTVVGALLAIASDKNQSVLISQMALQIVKQVDDYIKVPKNLSIITCFEPFFKEIRSNDDCRVPILLYLYRNRIYDLILPFIEGKTTTFTNMAIIFILKQLNNEQLKKIVESKSFQKKFIRKFSMNRLNGHLTKFAQILIEKSDISSQLQSLSWNRFRSTTIIPRIRKYTASYGGKTCTSCLSDSPPLRVQLQKFLEEQKNFDEDDDCSKSTKKLPRNMNNYHSRLPYQIPQT